MLVGRVRDRERLSGGLETEGIIGCELIARLRVNAVSFGNRHVICCVSGSSVGQCERGHVGNENLGDVSGEVRKLNFSSVLTETGANICSTWE